MPPATANLNDRETAIVSAIDEWLVSRLLTGGRWFVEHSRGIRDLILFLDYELDDDELDLALLEAVAAQFDWSITQINPRVLLFSKDQAVFDQYDVAA
jgi:hypothetical protein